jgi:hypothetical protein
MLNLTIDEILNPGTIEVFRVQQAWTENGITHNNQPTTDSSPVASFNVQASDTSVQVDITALVSAWISQHSSLPGRQARQLLSALPSNTPARRASCSIPARPATIHTST